MSEGWGPLEEAIAVAGVAIGTAIAIWGWPSWTWSTLGTWAGAAGSASAAWAAVWAARYPHRLKRLENKDTGALEAAASRNIIGMIQATASSARSPDASADQVRQLCTEAIENLNLIPIASIQHFDIKLAHALRNARGQLVIARVAAANPKIVKMAIGGVNKYLAEAMHSLKRADEYVELLVKKADQDVQG